MSSDHLDRYDARLASALREGLAARDRSVRAPRFASLWPDSNARPAGTFSWRPAFAVLATVLVVAALSWTWIDRSASPESPMLQASVEASLAHELSSPDYWRVPTDELLAFAAPPLNADLPSPSGFEVSLEESVL